MYVLGTPKNGGQGTFASVPAIYNEVASTRPDLVRVLSNDDWPFDRLVALVMSIADGSVKPS